MPARCGVATGVMGQRADSDLQRDVAVLLGRILIALVAQHGKRRDQLSSRETRLDDLVDVSPLGGDVGIGELLLVLRDLLLAIE